MYNLTKQFPDFERYALSSQMQRAAISIVSNIAKGAARQSVREFIQFLCLSLGSLAELETQLIIVFKLNYLSETAFKEINGKIETLRKQLLNFIKYQKEKLNHGEK